MTQSHVSLGPHSHESFSTEGAERLRTRDSRQQSISTQGTSDFSQSTDKSTETLLTAMDKDLSDVPCIDDPRLCLYFPLHLWCYKVRTFAAYPTWHCADIGTVYLESLQDRELHTSWPLDASNGILKVCRSQPSRDYETMQGFGKCLHP